MRNTFTRMISVTIGVTDIDFESMYEDYVNRDPDEVEDFAIAKIVESFLEEEPDFQNLVDLDWPEALEVKAEICEEFKQRYCEEEGE